MIEKPKAIILGGTIAHAFLIKQLQARGYFTILIDFNSAPPAADVADMHICESTLDQHKVLDIAKAWTVDIVISGCVDQANVTACYVAEKLNLPAPYSYRTSLRVTNKILMKRGMEKANIPTAKYQVLTGQESVLFDVDQFPKMVKPTDSNGSKGVRKANTQQELEQSVSEACSISKSQKAIVEDFNAGAEVSAYFYLKDAEATLLYTKGKVAPNSTGTETHNSFISIGPEEMPAELVAKLITVANQISNEFNLKNTPLLVQLNIDGTDMKVIEFAPRVGGGLAFREILMLTGFDMISAVIDSYLNNEVDLNFVSPAKNKKVSIVHCYGDGGIFDKITGLEKLKDAGIVEEFYIFKKKGDLLYRDNLASKNRVFGMMLVAESVAALQKKIKIAMDNISIISDDGRDVLNRSWSK